MTPAKIGSPSQRLVTILSILSEVVYPPDALFVFTEETTTSLIDEYLSEATRESDSSSSAFSRSSIISDISSHDSPILSIARTSLSRALTEYHLRCPSGTFPSSFPEISEMLFSRGSESLTGFGVSPADDIASRSSSIPSPLSADIPTTLHPSALESFSVSITVPSLLTVSIMFSAMTVGMPMSSIWLVRYRFLSMFVASTMFIIASGLLSSRKSRETTSSGEYGERE